MKPHMIITEADVIAAKIRAGQRPTLFLNRPADSSVHTDANDKCRDMDCPCWWVLPALPEDREALDILIPFDALPGEPDDDEFRSGMGDAYLCWYDERYIAERPELTCDGLVKFMTSPCYEGESERRRLGFIAGTLIAFGESNPRFLYYRGAERPSHETEG